MDRQVELLRSGGHEIRLFERRSDEIGVSARRRITVSGSVLWSPNARRAVGRVLDSFRPDVTHVHNTFPLISPSILGPCAQESAVVASFHNFRLVCPQGQLLRNDAPCELCVGRSPWPAVRYRCYRGSRLATVPLALAVAMHGSLATWNRHVAAFVALSEFSRDRLVSGGLDPSRFHVLPNFSPEPAAVRDGPGRHFLFLGRLSPEKAPDFLVEVWRSEFGRLLIVGTGPLLESIRARAAQLRNGVEVVGPKTHDEAMKLLVQARGLIIPSRWYEVSPLVVAEAFARHVPVVAPAQGSFVEMIRDDAGILFEPGDATGMAAAVVRLGDDRVALRMGDCARALYQHHYMPRAYLERLLAIYSDARLRRIETMRSGLSLSR